MRLTGQAASEARTAESAHRRRRDDLVLLLDGLGVPAPAAEPAYALPFPITSQAAALRLAVRIEERTGAVWRAVLPVTSGEQRATALDALVDCAVRATRWRRRANTVPLTVAYPGRPG